MSISYVINRYNMLKKLKFNKQYQDLATNNISLDAVNDPNTNDLNETQNDNTKNNKTKLTQIYTFIR